MLTVSSLLHCMASHTLGWGSQQFPLLLQYSLPHWRSQLELQNWDIFYEFLVCLFIYFSFCPSKGKTEAGEIVGASEQLCTKTFRKCYMFWRFSLKYKYFSYCAFKILAGWMFRTFLLTSLLVSKLSVPVTEQCWLFVHATPYICQNTVILKQSFQALVAWIGSI